jgi:hypothetical protein
VVTVTNTVTDENTEAVYEKFNVLLICKKDNGIKIWHAMASDPQEWRTALETEVHDGLQRLRRIKRICKTRNCVRQVTQ